MDPKIGSRKNPKRTDLSKVVPLSTPYVLFVDPSSACNFKCTFCPTGDLPLLKSIGRFQGTLKLPDFEKIVRDAEQFDESIKVLRLYKDGEPLVNKHLVEMVSLAAKSGVFESIDTTTNAALLTHEKSEKLVEAGINLINISIDGLDSDQFLHFTKAKIDFEKFIENIQYLYSIRDNCKIVIKTTKEIIGTDRIQEFYDIFGGMCDVIGVENTSPCWPDFDVEERMGISITEGLYGNQIVDQTACPYLFYSMSVNSDMKVSACFVDWSRDLIIGDLRTSSLAEIWDSKEMNAHRMAHLTGQRSKHKTCGSCGQISHCGPDSIEDVLPEIKMKFESQHKFMGLEQTIIEIGYSGNQGNRKLIPLSEV
jgi:radical SAM protein with 4Fe4S-binding SPASM domain